jgi:hypothetical protein
VVSGRNSRLPGQSICATHRERRASIPTGLYENSPDGPRRHRCAPRHQREEGNLRSMDDEASTVAARAIEDPRHRRAWRARLGRCEVQQPQQPCVLGPESSHLVPQPRQFPIHGRAWHRQLAVRLGINRHDRTVGDQSPWRERCCYQDFDVIVWRESSQSRGLIAFAPCSFPDRPPI